MGKTGRGGERANARVVLPLWEPSRWHPDLAGRQLQALVYGDRQPAPAAAWPPCQGPPRVRPRFLSDQQRGEQDPLVAPHLHVSILRPTPRAGARSCRSNEPLPAPPQADERRRVRRTKRGLPHLHLLYRSSSQVLSPNNMPTPPTRPPLSRASIFPPPPFPPRWLHLWCPPTLSKHTPRSRLPTIRTFAPRPCRGTTFLTL